VKISMKKSIVFFLACLALVSLSLTLVPKAASQPENIKILSYSWYTDSYGDFIVVGEIQNVGPNTIASVGLSGTVYTQDGTAQAYGYGSAYVNYLSPQQKAPFYIDFTPQTSVTGDLSWVSLGIDHVDFNVVEAETTNKYQYPDLSVTDSSGSADSEGVYWVSGHVKNSGTQTATYVRVIGTFYNSAGTVVAIGYTDSITGYTEDQAHLPIPLDPSSTTSFTVGAFDRNQSEVASDQKIANYALLVQTEEPILSGTPPSPTPTPEATPTPTPTSSPDIPEFPVWTLLLPFMVATMLTAVFCFKKRKR
jgi:hypothetical protein